MEELKNGLHQAKFEKCLQAVKENGGDNADINAIDCTKYGIDKEDVVFVIKNFDKISATGIKAWDYARYANNVNMAQGAGLLTDAECDELMKSLLATARAPTVTGRLTSLILIWGVAFGEVTKVMRKCLAVTLRC